MQANQERRSLFTEESALPSKLELINCCLIYGFLLQLHSLGFVLKSRRKVSLSNVVCQECFQRGPNSFPTGKKHRPFELSWWPEASLKDKLPQRKRRKVPLPARESRGRLLQRPIRSSAHQEILSGLELLCDDKHLPFTLDALPQQAVLTLPLPGQPLEMEKKEAVFPPRCSRRDTIFRALPEAGQDCPRTQALPAKALCNQPSNRASLQEKKAGAGPPNGSAPRLQPRDAAPALQENRRGQELGSPQQPGCPLLLHPCPSPSIPEHNPSWQV